MSSVGLAYDMRECEGCGHLYDHEFADWEATECGNCHDDE